MSLVVDLNADLGEGAGHDDELLALVTSANIACGFHAGDAETMGRSIEAARARKVAVGAHPSLFDRENFGRKELPVENDEVFDAVVYQLGIFQAIAEAAGVQPNHVKPHGALYNMAVRDQELADAIGRAVAKVDLSLILFAPQNSALARAGKTNGLQIAHEVFADRNYLSDGSLVPRSRPDALLHDPEEAAVRVVRMLREGKVHSVDGVDVDVRAETVCVHGDTPGAVDFARILKSRLEKEGVVIRSMIGSGIFITSAESARLSGAPGWLLLAWVIAGLLTMTGALCCSELATMMPRAGGVYVFFREAYGPAMGFLYGWTLFLVVQTGTIAAVAIAFAKFLGVFVSAISPDNYLFTKQPILLGGGYAISLSTQQLTAIGLIALLTWTNTRGLKLGTLVQNTFTFAQTAALAGVVVVGGFLGWSATSAARTSAWWNSSANGWSPQVAQPGFKFVGELA